ncbi:hypothetical protein [Candidatus Nitrospira bockiana]
MKAVKSADLLQQAVQHMNDGKYSRSFAVLKELLAADPSHYEGRHLLATLLLKFGNLATAKSAFESLIKEAMHRGAHADAEALLREYLAVASRCIPFIELLGQVYEAKGDPLAAVFEYEKAVDLLLAEPDPERPDYAQQLFDRIKLLAPSSFVANRVAARMPAPDAPPVVDGDDVQDGREDQGDHDEAEQGVLEAEDVSVPPTDEPDDREADEDAPSMLSPHPDSADERVEGDADSDGPEEEVSPVGADGREQDGDSSDVDERVPFPPVNSMPVGGSSVSEPVLFGPGKSASMTEAPAAPESSPPADAEVPAVFEEPLPSGSGDQGDEDSPRGVFVPPWAHSPDGFALRPQAPAQDPYWGRVTGATPEAHAPTPSREIPRPRSTARESGRRAIPSVLTQWVFRYVRILTRRLIRMTNSFTRLTLFVCIAAVAWLVLVVLGTAGVWLGMEQKPSALFEQLSRIAPPKVLDDAKHNGYLLLLGIDAPASSDPMQDGYTRWLSAPAESPTDGDSDSTHSLTGDLRRPAAWFQAPDPAARMAVEGVEVREKVDPKARLLTRYKQWLGLPFDDWGFGYRGSMDAETILAVHRLYLAEGFAQGLSPGLERLETDLTAWRTVLAQAKTASMKRLAAESVNDDVAVMSGLLMRPAVEQKVLQRVTRMARPLEAEERSLRWPMHNEFPLAVKRVDARLRRKADKDPILTVVLSKMPLPKQRTLNEYAAYYDALTKVAWTPKTTWPRLQDFIHAPAGSWLDYYRNPIDNLLGPDPHPDWEQLNGMVLETDARLRLTGLQARLRGAASSGSVVTQIAQAGPKYYDPFTELPMLVNTGRRALYSVGVDRRDDQGDPTRDVVAGFPTP